MNDNTRQHQGRQAIYSGSEYERTYSYARAVALNGHIRLSGTTGYDYVADVLADGAQAQTEQIFRNAGHALGQAGATLRDVVRVRIYIARVEDYDAVMDVYAAAFRGVDPACTTVQAGLFDPAIRVEIDMDAIVDATA
ncbi:Rid family hydrolase [Achromobacter pestifer]|uniref:Aminoacrylate peracid reductase RutC n=1 Tax=Achromobacter pestifer TaxID=1353889 RepID=A0A6S6Z461_9BURK|nr:Rid family hydrolase [Achromobacter pestifer]CAB3661567.1 Putative aminoacrylate peracid reductase RutC [Achromobacter pestifer]